VQSVATLLANLKSPSASSGIGTVSMQYIENAGVTVDMNTGQGQGSQACINTKACIAAKSNLNTYTACGYEQLFYQNVENWLAMMNPDDGVVSESSCHGLPRSTSLGDYPDTHVQLTADPAIQKAVGAAVNLGDMPVVPPVAHTYTGTLTSNATTKVPGTSACDPYVTQGTSTSTAQLIVGSSLENPGTFSGTFDLGVMTTVITIPSYNCYVYTDTGTIENTVPGSTSTTTTPAAGIGPINGTVTQSGSALSITFSGSTYNGTVSVVPGSVSIDMVTPATTTSVNGMDVTVTLDLKLGGTN
jgi:hypothetical protein